MKKQGRWRIYLPRSNEFIVTAHASFVDHRLGTEFKSTKGIITSNEEENYLRVEKYPVEAVVTSNVGSSTALVTKVNHQQSKHETSHNLRSSDGFIGREQVQAVSQKNHISRSSPEPNLSRQSSELMPRALRGESDTLVLPGNAASTSPEADLSRQSSELMPRALRGESDTSVRPGNAATKVIVGTGGGPDQEGGLSRQLLDSIPSRTGRTIESGMGSSLPVSTGRYVSGTTDVETRVGYATASEIKSLGQGMSDHNDSGVMSSGRIVCASGRGASGCSVQSKATDSMGKRASSPLWPYPTVSQDTLSLYLMGDSAREEN